MVVDTNIVVSAGIHLGGAPAKILDLVLEGELQVFTCPTVVEEYIEVLNRPRFAKYLFPPLWLPIFLRCCIAREQDPPPWPMAGPDLDDLVFLALAKQAGAVLITGNIDDYPEAIRMGVEVVTPRAYLDAFIAS